MVQCSVVGCKSRSERKMENITFHVFPKALILREIWIRATGRQNWQPQLHSRICSIHFERNLFRKTAHRVYLDKFPVPKFLIHLEKDIRNYMKYKMGFSSKILLSEKTLPSKFHCQEDYKRLGESDRQSAVVVQRKRKREKELVRHVEEGCHLEVQNMKDTVQKGVNIVRDEIKPDEDTSGAQGRKTTTDILQMIDKSIQLPNDMANYMQYHVMGSVSQIRMKPGCVPSKFECQPDGSKPTSDSNKRKYGAKKQKRKIISEAEQELQNETTTTSTEQLELEDPTPGTSAMQESTTKDAPKMVNKSIKVYIRNKFRSKVVYTEIKSKPFCRSAFTSPFKITSTKPSISNIQKCSKKIGY